MILSKCIVSILQATNARNRWCTCDTFDIIPHHLQTEVTYSLDCICWLVQVVADSSVFIQSNIVWNQWISPLKARSIRTSLNQGTSMQRQSVYFYSSGGIFESGTRSSFTINSTQLQMFAYILASSLEWCTSKRYPYKSAFVKIFSTKFEGWCKYFCESATETGTLTLTYQEIVFYAGDLLTDEDFDTMIYAGCWCKCWFWQ